MRTAQGIESPVKSAVILLREPFDFSAGISLDSNNQTGWHLFTVTKAQFYEIRTSDGFTSPGLKLSLFGPNDMDRLVSHAYPTRAGAAARIINKLEPGTYYVRVLPLKTGLSGFYQPYLIENAAPIFLENLSAPLITWDRKVVLNNTVYGTPVRYMASESKSFKGASWKAYTAAPVFTLSSDYADKKIYFKVQDAMGHQSNVLTATTSYQKSNSLELERDVREESGVFRISINKAGVYLFTVTSDDPAGYALFQIFQGLTTENPLGGRDIHAQDPYALTLNPGTYSLRISSKWKFTIHITKFTPTAPMVTRTEWYSLGDALNTTISLYIGIVAIGKPVQYQVSFSSDFAKADWKPFTTNLELDIPRSTQSKTVYLRVRDAAGRLSGTASVVTIPGFPVQPLTINAPAVTESREQERYFTFNVTRAGLYTVETVLYDDYASQDNLAWDVYDAHRVVQPRVFDNQNNHEAYPTATYSLAPGIYTIRVSESGHDLDEIPPGDFDIRVASGFGNAAYVVSLALDGGLESATGDEVTLENICVGSPVEYYINGFGWQPYSTAPATSVWVPARPGLGGATFMVRSASGIESNVCSDTITMD